MFKILVPNWKHPSTLQRQLLNAAREKFRILMLKQVVVPIQYALNGIIILADYENI
jgi:hypothetical protein